MAKSENRVASGDQSHWKILFRRFRFWSLYISIISVPLSFQLGYISIIDWGLASYIDSSTLIQVFIDTLGVFSGFAVIFGCVYIILCIILQFTSERTENGLNVHVLGRNFGSPADVSGVLTTILSVFLAIILIGILGAVSTMLLVALTIALGVFSTADWRKEGSVRCLFSGEFARFESDYTFGRPSIVRTIITQAVLIAFLVGRMFGDLVNHEECQKIDTLHGECATLVFETSVGFVLISNQTKKIYFVSYENGPIFTQESRGRLL